MLKLTLICLIIFTKSTLAEHYEGPDPMGNTSDSEVFKYISEGYNSCKIMYNETGHAEQNLTVLQHKYAATLAKYRSAYLMDFLIHKYDSEEEHRISGGPLVDQELCLRHLTELNQRSIQQRKLKLKSKDVELYRLLDTYGKFPPAYMLGNAFWIGRYEECLSLRLNFGSTGEQQVPTRFCWAKLKYNGWPLDEDEVIKMGICLPKSCDSQRYKNKFELIHKLTEYNNREIDHNETVLIDVYCLPDEQSPLRLWYSNTGSSIFVLLLSVWLLFVAYCTYKYENLKVPKYRQRGQKVSDARESRFETYKNFAVTYNLRKLLKTNPMYCLKRYYRESNSEFKPRVEGCKTATRENLNPQRPILNMDLIEGIKVMGMVNIISAHALFFTSVTLSDVRTFKDIWSPIFMWQHMIPAFMVNIFFSISGLLGTYMIFKRNQQRPFMSNPIAWLALMIYRYIKLIVAYGFIVAYSKYFAKYTNSGPFWDYGTTTLGLRRVCEQESWWWTLLMVSNFKSAAEHCAAFGWYIASDFQFVVMMPIFLIALYKSPRLGKCLILTCCALSLLASYNEYTKIPSEHTIPVARVDPYGFRSLVSGFMKAYTFPHLRISSWLIGVLVGYYVYEYENKRYRYIKANIRALNEGKNPSIPKPELPLVLQNYGGYVCMLFVTFFSCQSFVLRYLARRGLDFPNLNTSALTFVHFAYAAIASLYVLIGSAGYGNKWVNMVLSAPFWKPISRMSICALVVNLEFVMYYLQGMSHLQRVTNYNLMSMYTFAITGTYLMSAVLFVLFDEPLGRFLQGKLFKFATKLQSSTSKHNKFND